ncbi:MAG TPA: M48 family metalloprotease [Blastocatellia bacterium]|nr:M48 family metalloprotease [Blastocatellia bacterium]
MRSITKRTIVRRTLAVLLAAALGGSLTLPIRAQEAQESKDEKKLRERQEKLQKKEEDRKKDEAKARTKEAKRYNTLREFAEDQYASDTDFHDEVDKAFIDLQSQHALQAYNINVTRTTELVAPETEDTQLKIRRVLYDNPWVQDYVNRVGQRLVPDDSDKLYAFKVTYHPIPYAYTLSTGTVLISTGMISLLDNEAQLSYVLAHELAHVYKDHWKVKVMMPLAEEEYNRRQEKKRALIGSLFAVAGAAIGGAAKGAEGAATGALVGLVAGYAIGAVYNRRIGIDWDEAQENEADDFALKTVMEKLYDAQEVPKLYVAMQDVSRSDERTQLGFLGLRSRLRQRREYAERQLQGSLQARYQELLKSGKVVGTTPEYNLVMAELKRDNGIEAYRFDMFEMARRNLKQAVSLRTDDARASFYYGRVLKLVGRTKEDRDTAQQYLLTAIRLDARRQIPEVQLQRALMLMENKDQAAQTEAAQALRDYIVAFQNKRVDDLRQDNSLPPNVDTLYDYLRLLGDKAWRAPTPGLMRLTSTGAVVPAADAPNPQTDRQRSVRQNQ